MCVAALIVLCGAVVYPATPSQESVTPQAHAVGQLMTPQAQIQLGVDRCDTELMMQRAGSRCSDITYPLRTLWRGIVEYLLPYHGIFRRGDILARVYDAELLPDLERARRLMSIADVTPLTIAPAPRPEPVSEAAPGNESGPRVAVPPSLRAAPVSPGGNEMTAGRAAAVQPASALAALSKSTSEPPGSDHDVAPPAQHAGSAAEGVAPASAPEIVTHYWRRQALLMAKAIGVATTRCNDAATALVQAQEELAHRERLYEAGVLADEALRPALEREATARRALEQVERELSEAQEGYARIARRIRALYEETAATSSDPGPGTSEVGADKPRDSTTVAGDEANAAAPVTPSAGSEVGEQEVPIRTASLRERSPNPAQARQVPPVTPEVKELAAPRWQELKAPATGMVADLVAPPGALVEEGQELLQLANVQLARLTAQVRQRNLPEFWAGRSVSITFADYPAVALEGWVASARPSEDSDDAEVELLVLCRSGLFANDAYLTLQWMILEAGVKAQDAEPRAIKPLAQPDPGGDAEKHLREILPVAGPCASQEPAGRVDRAASDRYVGRLRLRPMPRLQEASAQLAGSNAERLAALRQWRATYIDGMVTTILDDGTAITYPREGEVFRAVRRMLQARVSHRPNLCARTMREALGWGLGDAHAWAHGLPHTGYILREDGLPRPGDILVWPFTYGPGRGEHIGVAVRQGRRLMLLSNLGGSLGTSEILGGYVAFHKPQENRDRG